MGIERSGSDASSPKESGQPGAASGGYDADHAAAYDEEAELGVIADTDETVDRLASLAGAGPVLELGVGTGRVAIPLARRGLVVHGIDIAQAMLARLRAKPGGDGVHVAIGDFSTFQLDASFSLVYVVFDTFYGLLTQDNQVACFESVSRHLQPGGLFVIEVSVPTAMPDIRRFSEGESIAIKSLSEEVLQLDAGRHDPLTQRIALQRVVIRESGIRLFPIICRYAWPSELDLMARLAGLRLRERWADWRCRPFTAASTRSISVYASEQRDEIG